MLPSSTGWSHRRLRRQALRTLGALCFSSRPASTSPSFATKVESVPTGEAADGDKGTSESKRQAVERRAVPESTTLVEVPADGACLLHALPLLALASELRS